MGTPICLILATEGEIYQQPKCNRYTMLFFVYVGIATVVITRIIYKSNMSRGWGLGFSQKRSREEEEQLY